MTARVYEALRREKIEIPFPQQELHLRSVAPAVVELLARARGQTPGPTAAAAPATPPAPPPA
jgi:small-conductance mechanosensitive channel